MRFPPNAEPNSRDVSLASAALITSCSWKTLSTLRSDLLRILIRLQMKNWCLIYFTCKRNLANDLSAFFYNKILTIRSELGLPGLYKCGSMTTSFSGTPLSTFMDATEMEIWNIIQLSPAKSCELDPLPTWLLKECIAELVPTITDIVNMSLRDSLMPKSLKTALIRPLL